MQINYVVIQAGGLGTRLGHLTRNKPKCLVAVNNRPILFHAFECFPNAHFIIIGDYQYSVLEVYLGTFANIDYKLVRTYEKGNAAGIGVALEYVPEGTPFLLMWSDIILSRDITFSNLPDGEYIGLTSEFPCSWCMEDGVLVKKPKGEFGVAGVFVFSDKSILSELPFEGSFMSWISESGIHMKPFDILNSKEVSTLDAIRSIDSVVNRCRPYNSLEFIDGKVIKTALTEKGQKLLDKEITYYQKMQEYGFHYIPEIYSYSPLTMSQIYGKNIFEAPLDDDGKRATISHLVNALKLMHSYGSCHADKDSLYIEYYEKTLARLDSVKDVIPFAGKKYITINGKQCNNVLFFRSEFYKLVEMRLPCDEFVPIHGDATLTNTMIDSKNKIYFIDARGYFGKNEVFGDAYYDWAKLYYSVCGNFDNFNIKKFTLEITGKEVRYEICSSGWEHFTSYLLSFIPDCNLEKIRIIHAIIWLSLASHCYEDYDSLCTAFYVGIYLLREWLGDIY